MRNFIIVRPVKLDELEGKRGIISGTARRPNVDIIKLIIQFKKQYNRTLSMFNNATLVEEYINSNTTGTRECTSILDCFIKKSGLNFGIRGGKQVTHKRRPYKSKNIRKHRIKTKTKKAKKRKTIKKKAKY